MNMTKTYEERVYVDEHISPLPKEQRTAPLLKIGGEFYVSFGSNGAYRCQVTDVIKEEAKTKVKVVLPPELPMLKSTPVLYEDEIGATPEEAVRNAVQRVLYVGNLSLKVTNEDLRPLFEQFGKVDCIEVIFNSSTGRSKGFAFVTMCDEESAHRAMRALEGLSLKGKSMILSLAPDKSLYEHNDNTNTGFW
jgi:RNA recognition motif-containing protein